MQKKFLSIVFTFINLWAFAQNGQGYATLEYSTNNVLPGCNAFGVIAASHNSIWNTKGQSIDIEITSPFWATWLFRITLSVIIVLILVLFHFWRSRYITKKKNRLKRLMRHRTIELSNANHILKEQEKKLEQQTAELIQHKKEIIIQKEYISEINDILQQQKKAITLQNKELEKYRNDLEFLVKKRTIELEKAKIQAEESDKLKSSFLANMSHEIRTPLNAIVGFTGLIAHADISPDRIREIYEIIRQSANHLTNLIDDIIDISRIEAGELTVVNKCINIIDILSELAMQFAAQCKHHPDLSVIFENKHELKELNVYTDEHRFSQIVSNLLSNAIKFTEHGTIRLGYSLDELQEITIYVSDTGIGIASEHQQSIFNRFSKVETDNTKLYRGNGLGLAITKKLVELTGGRIWVVSKPNSGSTFFFTQST